ncbi:MAG: hypothetical protein EOM72_05875 [Opitutae bacterium]|nr:hypothetical protein [Opitutae bacterium]
MKKNQTIRTVFVALGMILLLALAAQAQVPQMMSYQGRVTAGGTNVNGMGYFKFALVDSTGNVLYWSHDGTTVFPPPFEPDTSVPLTVADGLFAVMLGGDAMNAMHNSVFLNNDAHLRVWFSEDDVAFTQLTPDQPLGSVGYAAMAAQVSNGAIGEDQLVSGAVTVFKIGNGAVTGVKLSAGSVTGDKVVNGTITSNKIDWSTMPAFPQPLKGHAENGAFAAAPTASGTDAIALGLGTTASGDYSVVGGGRDNTAGNEDTTVAGGAQNSAAGPKATVSGGWWNRAIYEAATVGGGVNNVASGSGATVSGGQANFATNYSVVGGGIQNRASGTNSVVAGGGWNWAHSNYATVGGGWTNTASGLYATVSGGDGNTASGWTSTVGGGDKNTASGTDSTIGGGIRNAANSTGATVGGGFTNTASGTYATIPGGRNNFATNFAFAAGRRAKANHEGALVWGDSTDADIVSTNNNSVTFRAAGGYRLFSDSGATLGAHLPPNVTSWSALSDREAKENFEAIDTGAILDKLAALPLTAWNYKADPGRRRYIGPVAQDFHAAFGLGDDTTINTLDADGVALAAIQGVNRKLEAEVAELKARIERLEALIAGMQ